MRARAAAALAAAALPAVLAGCGGGGAAPATTAAVPARPEPPSTAPARTGASRPAAPGPFAPGGLTAIVNTLTRQLGHRPRFLSIGAYPTYAIMAVQDRRAPRNVDRYVWRDGVISGPEPVRIVGAADELPARLFRASAVNLRAVPRLARRGDRLPFEGSETSGIVIESGRPFVPFVRFLVNVSGTRESRQMRADPRGRVYEII